LNPLITFLCLITIWIGYDLHSGVLHVVFDHPDNVNLPLIGQACLEFQWHHSIPDDLVRKDFVDVCGDLNIVIGLLIGIQLCLLDIHNPVSLVLGGCKITMAYFGQFSHKSAHTHSTHQPAIAKTLQKAGIMVSNKDHASHHKEPYDEDFCLIGLCNPIIDGLRIYVTTNNNAWLAFFFALSIFDLMIYSTAVSYIAELI